MADTSDFRNGLTLVWNGDLWSIVEFQHVKPGKGGAFVRTKLKNVRNGKVVDNTFRSGEKVEVARVERHAFQYLYQDDLGMHFMHNETYEQLSVPADLVEGRDYLKEGESAEALIYVETNETVKVEVPRHVELRVVETDPGLKGDTAQGGSKPAQLESGAVISVPLFVNEGDLLRVDTQTGDYITRVR
ncbi:MAG: elongation factor P [Rhodothermales bacterium]|jgi:elongation factor P